MNAAELKAEAVRILGTEKGWKSAISRKYGIDPRTVRRWCAADNIPDWFADLVTPANPYPVCDGCGSRDVARVYVCPHCDGRVTVQWIGGPEPTQEGTQ